MKSMSRGCCEPAAVTSTMLSPQRMTTEPPACLAHLPVSIDDLFAADDGGLANERHTCSP